MGTMTTCTCATRGGTTRPLSSPCVRIITPSERVVKPHEFWNTKQGAFSAPPPAPAAPSSAGSKEISNILEKFWPRWCEVAACTPRPLPGMKPSMEVVKSAPANFSDSLLRPLTTGTHSSSS